MVAGWQTEAATCLQETMEKVHRVRRSRIPHNFHNSDGTLSGPDLETLQEACAQPDVEIIAAGGIGSLNDLIALKRIGVAGVVIGKALYEGRFTLKEALNSIGEA